jgi:hypothetical protein
MSSSARIAGRRPRKRLTSQMICEEMWRVDVRSFRSGPPFVRMPGVNLSRSSPPHATSAGSVGGSGAPVVGDAAPSCTHGAAGPAAAGGTGQSYPPRTTD